MLALDLWHVLQFFFSLIVVVISVFDFFDAIVVGHVSR